MEPTPESTNSTWPSATSSEAMSIGRYVAWLLAAFLAAGSPAWGKVFLTVDEALELAFPGAEISEVTIFLTEAQLAQAEELAGLEISSALARAYVARNGEGEIVGTAYFDSHRVRTLPETLMIVVGTEGEVERLEIVSFKEPEDYIPNEIWYEQFLEEPLSEDLRLGREIRAVTGATLTARATTQAVRRVLAIHQVLGEGNAP